jgi:hypothetical protein
VVEVVGEPYLDSPLRRSDERRTDEMGGLVLQPEVVERELEARPSLLAEPCDGVRDVECRLAAGGERAELEPFGERRSGPLPSYPACALSFALYARLASW